MTKAKTKAKAPEAERDFQAIRKAGLLHRASVLRVDKAVDLACFYIRCPHTRAILKAAAAANHRTASGLREAILTACPEIHPITQGEIVALGGGGTKTGGGGGG